MSLLYVAGFEEVSRGSLEYLKFQGTHNCKTLGPVSDWFEKANEAYNQVF